MPITFSSSILTSFYYSVKIRQKPPFLHTVKAYATQAAPTKLGWRNTQEKEVSNKEKID